jgi:two-component system sensor histidine kinase VanS
MPRTQPTTPRPRGLSLRWQLTLSYAAFVVVVGIVLIAVGVLLLRFVPDGNLVEAGGGFAPSRSDLMPVFVKYAAAGLVFLATLGLGGGWLLAGRLLRRLRLITGTAERVRGGDLDHRIDMAGRSDELSELADTFDDMLERVQASLDEHQRFAANASHELRTPHAMIRTMLEVARADPDRDVEQLLERVEIVNERSIALTEALLSLTRAQNAKEDREPVDLATLAAAAAEELGAVATRRDVTITCELLTAATTGHPELLARLVTNLVQNAVVHNHPGGHVQVATWTHQHGDAVVEITNTGPVVTDEVAATLLEPFVRAAGRTRSRDQSHVGAGLGLSIVASVVRAHAGSIDVTPRAGGGLSVRVQVPAS